MRIQVISNGRAVDPTAPVMPRQILPLPVSYGGWRPRCVLGAPTPGGLALPPAQATASWLYGPRAAWTDGTRVVAADTGNHRVLIWNRLPDQDGAPADVVLGQADEFSEGPAAGGAGPAQGMHLPTGVLVQDGRLLVADAWHHRVLIWNTLPETTGTAPDLVLGQPDHDEVQPNAGADPSAATFYWPFGIAVVAGRFYVADTGNRRVLGWSGGIPEPGQPADLVLGQPDATSREENRGGEVSRHSFRWPHAIAGTAGGGLLIADAGNHRVLRWDEQPDLDRPADAVLGQPDFYHGSEFPYTSQQGLLRFPYGLSTAGTRLAVADTANNRVLLYGSDHAVHNEVPEIVLGQLNPADSGENRWDHVGSDTMCWPYGVHWHQPGRPGGGPELLLVADSGNNRVVIWERP